MRSPYAGRPDERTLGHEKPFGCIQQTPVAHSFSTLPTVKRHLAAVGFEPTPFRTGALNRRLRPLGHATYNLRALLFHTPSYPNHSTISFSSSTAIQDQWLAFLTELTLLLYSQHLAHSPYLLLAFGKALVIPSDARHIIPSPLNTSDAQLGITMPEAKRPLRRGGFEPPT